MQGRDTSGNPSESEQQAQSLFKKIAVKNKSKKRIYIIFGSVFFIFLIGGFLFIRLFMLPSQGLQSRHNTKAPSMVSKERPKHWILGNGVANALNNTAIGTQFIQSINNANTYENGRIKQDISDPLPNATHIEIFPSYQAIKAAFENKSIPSYIKVIGYDNEHWPQTPLIEQQQPFTYVPLAEQLVHEHGLLFMNTPAADLKLVLEPKAKDQYAGYLDEKLATLAHYTDIFEIQAQNAPSASEYLSFTHQAMAEARASNKKAIILLGITAKINGPTSQELIQEIQDTEGITDGYWFNIIGGKSGINIALSVIQALPSM